MSSVLIIESSGQTEQVNISENENVLSLLRRSGHEIYAPCGGNGRCGRCLVGINGEMRPACLTRAEDGMTVRLPESSGSTGEIVSESSVGQSAAGEDGRVFAAVDLGTTTIAVKGIGEGCCIDAVCAWNRQAAFGADVISRIKYIMDSGDRALSHESGEIPSLTAMIRFQVWELIEKACSGKKPERIFLAGNTVMQHIFRGISPVSIAKAPFLPQTLFRGDTDDVLCGVPVEYSPCVSGYVGGDITAGIAALDLIEEEGSSLFLDIGTNGEMAIGGRDGFICCAAASGPAFEGAGISCGMTGTDGAVGRVFTDGGKIRFETVGGGEPAGICGSGLIDLIAVLLKTGIIDGSGRLLSPDEVETDYEECLSGGMRLEEDENENGVFYLTDKVYLTAADVRAYQLAKAAVAAGICVLVSESGLDYPQIRRLYVAGGFGMHLNIDSAVETGLLPREMRNRVTVCGNTSLAGAVKAAKDRAFREKLNRAADMCSYVELSGNAGFNYEFTENMMFQEE